MLKKQLFAVLLSLVAFAPLHANARALAAENQNGVSSDANVETASRELELFRAAEISLHDALTIAGGLRAGSRVVDIGFDGVSGLPVYRVKTFQRDRVWEDAIDATTGQVVGKARVSFLRDLDKEERSNLVALKTVRQGLVDAVRVAENEAFGKAISGGLVSEDGKLKFLVVVLSGTDLKLIILEPPSVNGRRTRRGMREKVKDASLRGKHAELAH
jgi:uncharacterized membrane protein YkoI